MSTSKNSGGVCYVYWQQMLSVHAQSVMNQFHAFDTRVSHDRLDGSANLLGLLFDLSRSYSR